MLTVLQRRGRRPAQPAARAAGLAALALLAPAAAGQDPEDAPPVGRALSPQLSDAPRDVTGAGQAFVELAAEPRAVHLEQPLRLRLTFGFEEEFLRGQAVQPFRRALDVPAQLVAPWLDGLPGAAVPQPGAAPPAAGDPGRPTFALNGEVQRARRLEDRTVDGARFRVFAFEAELVPTQVGELRLPAPVLHFAYATRFEESLLAERLPVDRVDAVVRGEPLVVAVAELPEEGRPWEFTGAVGRFAIRADVTPREVRVGEGLRLVVTIEGEGNLGRFEAPRWRELETFRVLGSLDEPTPGARVLTYDLAPLRADVRQVPALPFAWFDPGPPAGYRTASTEPIDVRVRPAEPGEPAAETGPNGRRAAQRPAGPRRVPARRMPLWVPLAGLGALGLLAVVLVLRRS